MDAAYGFERDEDPADEVIIEAPPPVIGGAERRLHVRAYEHWVSLLCGRAFPSIADLDFDALADFEPRSVLIDYTGDVTAPRIARIGATLRDECAVAGIESVADVPRGSLLSRLTDHYLEIIATRAPIGFEAEFTNHQGMPTLYRGILMPFSADGDTIDHVLGVINWKHTLPDDLTDALQREMAKLGGPGNSTRH
ncbi:hypothetical protein HJG53_01285 [Sphingomonas sp. ID1715]|uniref:hypothetical protein n=1 Tax=Sphingomonas sp. ID1715 TaxID=1656898 RepID=UPI001488E914|nr:hypothetical protein [Sphingomonas sp. ID1715]